MSTTENRTLPSINDVIKASSTPHIPIYCIRPKTLEVAVAAFITAFESTDIVYPVQCNSEIEVLNVLWKSGVRNFNCASVKECALIRSLFGPTAGVHYLHPLKALEDIRDAYTKYGVKTFALDCASELDKIVSVVKPDDDEVTLIVRLALNRYSEEEGFDDDEIELGYPLPIKFGIEGAKKAASLVQSARAKAKRLGVAFHVGSQCLSPRIYSEALDLVREVLEIAQVSVDIINIGGGFGVRYDAATKCPPLRRYMSAIVRGIECLPETLVSNARIWCEPGQVLVSGSGSLIIRVEGRRSAGGRNVLFVSDGVFGHLREASEELEGFLPVRLIRRSDANLIPFGLFGPTVDRHDFMPGPYNLPSDIKPGDYIEVGQLGAYSTCFRTSFNGYDRVVTALVSDEPFLHP